MLLQHGKQPELSPKHECWAFRIKKNCDLCPVNGQINNGRAGEGSSPLVIQAGSWHHKHVCSLFCFAEQPFFLKWMNHFFLNYPLIKRWHYNCPVFMSCPAQDPTAMPCCRLHVSRLGWAGRTLLCCEERCCRAASRYGSQQRSSFPKERLNGEFRNVLAQPCLAQVTFSPFCW